MIPKYDIDFHLYKIRTNAGLTDRSLAELSGISKSQINQIEDGLANPTLRTMCSLSLALNVPPAELYSIRIIP